MTDRDRCAQTYPHPAHSRFGLKDCPGVPITPANAPTVPAGPAPASAPLHGLTGPTIRTLLGFQQRAAAALSELTQITAAMADHLAKLDEPDAPYPPAEMVWLGDLSGYFLSAERGEVVLNHRCGWEVRCVGTIPFLANLIVGPVEAHRDAGCNPHEG